MFSKDENKPAYVVFCRIFWLAIKYFSYFIDGETKIFIGKWLGFHSVADGAAHKTENIFTDFRPSNRFFSLIMKNGSI